VEGLFDHVEIHLGKSFVWEEVLASEEVVISYEENIFFCLCRG